MAILVLPDDLVVESIRFRAKEAHYRSDEKEATLRVDFLDDGSYYELRPSDGFVFDPQRAVGFVAGMLAVCDHNNAMDQRWSGSESRSGTLPPPPLSSNAEKVVGCEIITAAWLRSSPLYYQSSYEYEGKTHRLKVPGYSVELVVKEPVNGNVLWRVDRYISGAWQNSREVILRGSLLSWCRDQDIDLFPENAK